MEDLDRYLCELSTSVWEQTLGLTLEPAEPSAAPSGPSLQGRVRISGVWTGTLVFECSVGAAHRAAQIMFGTSGDDDSMQDRQDAVGELTNMIGGNLKALLSDDGCVLSLPVVTEGEGATRTDAGSQVIARQAFSAEREPVVVTLLRQAA